MNVDKGRKSYFNSGGWKVFVRKKMVGKEKQRNPERNEFPDAIGI